MRVGRKGCWKFSRGKPFLLRIEQDAAMAAIERVISPNLGSIVEEGENAFAGPARQWSNGTNLA